MIDLSNWKGAPRPVHAPIEGRYVRLEPLSAARHSADLFRAANGEDAEAQFRYLFETPPDTPEAMQVWASKAADSVDPLFFAVIDKRSGRVEGRQALMRIDTANGVIEIGNILWGPAIARTPAATEALFLFADYAFSQGYRRFEWKCNDLNAPSKRAAQRFGFTYEGLFRQHMVVKGQNRDTAWFAIIGSEWPRLKEGYLRWLSPENFDADGQQLQKLSFA